ncbi:hypothetical protein FBQ73_06275 [Xanthobacter autotrophicus]|uniref:Cysteine-rich CWC family protein n=1 Tax=Xanthobacter autotrophicus TaxID=280 RepID=A0A6C1KJW8_XANAU|nr:hypothetical protein FBQ73_06275 [Xanthobacter autotrophicus]
MPARRLRCERCGAEFTCGSAASAPAPRCWCQDLPPLKVKLPEGDCLCPDCLRHEIQRHEIQRHESKHDESQDQRPLQNRRQS